MQIDTERWQRLREAAADAEHDGPDFLTIQAANGRAAQARDQLARLKATGPQGRASGPPIARARAGEQILPGVGGTSEADVTRAFETSVRELEQRVSEAQREAKRLADRLQQCSARRNALNQLIDDVRRWAAQQTPPLRLDGDAEQLSSVGIVHGPPPGAADFISGRTA